MRIEQLNYSKDEVWKLCREDNVYIIRRYKGYEKKTKSGKQGAHTNDFYRGIQMRSLEKLSLKEIE